MNTFQQLDALRAGGIDIGFQYNQEQDRDSLRVLPLRTDRYAMAMPAQHPLAAKKRLRAEDLRDVPLVWLSRPQKGGAGASDAASGAQAK